MCWVLVLAPPFFFSLFCVALCRYTYHAGRDIVVLLFPFFLLVFYFSFPPFNFLNLPCLHRGATVHVQSAQYSIHCILGRLAFTRFVRFSLDEFHKAINKQKFQEMVKMNNSFKSNTQLVKSFPRLYLLQRYTPSLGLKISFPTKKGKPS